MNIQDKIYRKQINEYFTNKSNNLLKLNEIKSIKILSSGTIKAEIIFKELKTKRIYNYTIYVNKKGYYKIMEDGSNFNIRMYHKDKHISFSILRRFIIRNIEDIKKLIKENNEKN